MIKDWLIAAIDKLMIVLIITMIAASTDETLRVERAINHS